MENSTLPVSSASPSGATGLVLVPLPYQKPIDAANPGPGPGTMVWRAEEGRPFCVIQTTTITACCAGVLDVN
ncbi:MAG: hypothetical protein ABSG62_20960 [Terracidiphilus sp.]